MTQDDQVHRDNWADTHKLMTVTFFWGWRSTENECRLHNRTYNQALAIAKSFGYKEPKWYNPWTWNNGVITVG